MHPLEERTLAGLHGFLEGSVARVPRTAPVLDLGCGSGAGLARLKRLGFTDLWGVDAEAGPGIDGMTFVRADLDRELPRIDAQFGLITLIEVIEHLANPGAIMSFVSGCLREDGLVLLTTPNIQSLRCRVKFALTGNLASFDEKGDPTHITPLLLAGFRKVAARARLEVTGCWTYPTRRSLIFGRRIRAAACLLRFFSLDPLPGDTLCLTLKRCTGKKRSSAE